MRPASQRFFIDIDLRILIISYLTTFLGNNSLFVLKCRKAVDQSINQSIRLAQLVYSQCNGRSDVAKDRAVAFGI